MMMVIDYHSFYHHHQFAPFDGLCPRSGKPLGDVQFTTFENLHVQHQTTGLHMQEFDPVAPRVDEHKAYTYYGKKQGSCVCLWDVSNAVYTDCEQTGNRHDEQIWVIAVDKPIAGTRVTYARNYIYDMKPGPKGKRGRPAKPAKETLT